MLIGVQTCRRVRGFTLVELMVTLVIAFIISGAAYSAYVIQQKSHAVQGQVAEMQQNVRVGLEIMAREMRMAGYDPTFSDEYGIVIATTDQFGFTADICDDGGVPKNSTDSSCGITEIFLYELYDQNDDGVNDSLQRTATGSSVVENVEHLEFLYILADGNRKVDPTPLELKQIVAVEISLLVRASEADHNYRNTGTFTTASGEIVDPDPDDGYRRRMLITTIQLRNLAYRS